MGFQEKQFVVGNTCNHFIFLEKDLLVVNHLTYICMGYPIIEIFVVVHW